MLRFRCRCSIAIRATCRRLISGSTNPRTNSATELRIPTDLVQTYEALAAAENQIKSLRDQILPDAKSAFEAANKGYQFGKFGFLEVLDAQRTLSQNQALHLQAVAAYQGLVADLERLVASPLDRTIKN